MVQWHFENLVAFAASASYDFRTSCIKRLNETETSVVAGNKNYQTDSSKILVMFWRNLDGNAFTIFTNIHHAAFSQK